MRWAAGDRRGEERRGREEWSRRVWREAETEGADGNKTARSQLVKQLSSTTRKK